MPSDQIAPLEAIPGWEWSVGVGRRREEAFERGLAALAQFVDREGHAGVIQTHVESFEGADYNLGVWVMGRRARFKEGGLSTEQVAALEAFPGWDWGRRRGNSAVAFERGLAALAQFAEREGHAGVPQSHVESFEGAEYPLGVWVSRRRTEFRSGKLSAERTAVLKAVPGWEWNPGRR